MTGRVSEETLAELERAAGAASGGEWFVPDDFVGGAFWGSDAAAIRDGRHIAAADPSTVAALVAEVRGLRATVVRVEVLVSAAEQGAGAWGTCSHEWLTIRSLRDALDAEGAGSTHDGSAAPEDPVAGAREASEPDRCPDCEWVERPQRWVDAANGAEPELVLGKPCRKHGGPCGECRECTSGHWLRCCSPAAQAVPSGTHTPDPRPQQIIDDPAGWFARAREKRTAEVLAEAAGRAKEAGERRLGR